MLRYSFVLVLGLVCTSPVGAATWADALFDEVSRDFGSVPRGPTLSHPFRIANKTNVPVQISTVRVSCGCTSARVLQNYLAPGQETVVLVEMDTRRFFGSKQVDIFVQFSQPNFAEVRLWVLANSRNDVSVLPESLALGKVKRGGPALGSSTITFLGSPNWQITGVSCESNYVQPICEEIRRGGGEVAYKLTATMRNDAPAGKWFTDVWVETNNPASPRIRIPLTVEIESPLTISPVMVGLGEVKAGKVAERKVVVRGVQPFRIIGVQGTDKELTVRDSTPESKAVHVLTVTVQPHRIGELNRTLRVLTDLAGEEAIEFNAVAQVVK